MREPIRVHVAGWGELGRAVAQLVMEASDMELHSIASGHLNDVPEGFDVPVYKYVNMERFGKICEVPVKIGEEFDIAILCLGSKTQLPKILPIYVGNCFASINSFDTHADIYDMMKKYMISTGLHGISFGWDPGEFSLMREYFEASMPNGITITIWGIGKSQGHTNAIIEIDGVLMALQMTIPKAGYRRQIAEIKANIGKLLSDGPAAKFSGTDFHIRKCYVVADPKADKAKIRKTIKNMPEYFAGYNTTVQFVTPEVFEEKYGNIAYHGGQVIRIGQVGGHTAVKKYELEMASNPFYTGSILVAGARAIHRLRTKDKLSGVITARNVPLNYYSVETDSETLIRKFV